ncbi:MAG: hypothetical protein A3E85_05305 [Gammaproteobacteria bacterium RIFCSPHIGHO2_12_FULL_45_12]|nr:MAG: hypothetical protein A3E85_05305 [Gammaproteobacteria bacterium RIFCSPHIGHO2_12_FULL_45_12]
MSNLRLNLLLVALLGLLAFFQYRLWFEAGGIVDMLKLKKNLAAEASETEALQKKNDVLLSQIKRLKTSQLEVESRAREELGMMKKGETFYQIVN